MVFLTSELTQLSPRIPSDLLKVNSKKWLLNFFAHLTLNYLVEFVDGNDRYSLRNDFQYFFSMEVQ